MKVDIDQLGAEEREVAEMLWPNVGRHFHYLAGVFNLFVRFNLFFDGLPIRDIGPRTEATLHLCARLSNDIRGIQLLSGRGYGAQACSLAATIWELAWQATSICFDENEARQWLERSRITEGGLDFEKCLRRYLKRIQCPDLEKKFQLEKIVYGKLCAMKHGNPFIHSMRPVSDWDRHGMLRQGPDGSEFGQKSIRFAAEIGGHLSELALGEASKHLLNEDECQIFAPLLDASTKVRRALESDSKQRWSSFP
jgi:hypothetical protein